MPRPYIESYLSMIYYHLQMFNLLNFLPKPFDFLVHNLFFYFIYILFSHTIEHFLEGTRNWSLQRWRGFQELDAILYSLGPLRIKVFSIWTWSCQTRQRNFTRIPFSSRHKLQSSHHLCSDATKESNWRKSKVFYRSETPQYNDFLFSANFCATTMFVVDWWLLIGRNESHPRHRRAKEGTVCLGAFVER